MKTPIHVVKAALIIKDVCVKNRLYKSASKMENIIKQREKNIKFNQAVEIMKEIEQIALHLSSSYSFDCTKIYKEVRTQRGIRQYLIDAKRINPYAQYEIQEVLDFMEKAVNFELNWGQEDNNVKVREFKYLDDQEEWENVLNSAEGYGPVLELTKDREGNPFMEYVQMAYLSGDRLGNDQQKINKLNEQREQAIKEVGNIQRFWNSESKYFDLWYDLRTIGTYYIYIPYIPHVTR